MADRQRRATQRFIRMVVGSPRRASLKQRHLDVTSDWSSCMYHRTLEHTVHDRSVTSDATYLKAVYDRRVTVRQTTEIAPRTFPRIASSRLYGKP